MAATSAVASRGPTLRRDDGIAVKSFHGEGGGAEHFIAVEVPEDLGLDRQLRAAQERYDAARESLGLAPETAVFRRLFLSDVLNQANAVRNSALAVEPAQSPVAVSIVQQPPLPDAKIALLAYHVEGGGALAKRRLSNKHLLVERNGLGHLWSTRLCAGAYDLAASSAGQTRAVFDDLVGVLSGLGGTLRDNCVRTWLYLKDVDVFYKGMVNSRRELFKQHGLDENTHYIASTGIEGACAHQFDVVAMDAYSVIGLKPEQVSYLNDFDLLCATKDYNVTFERGTRVAYADRAHHYISGTASIDGAGQVVHPGDVLRQLDRAIENVEALLRSGGANLADMLHLIVYLRDPTDFARVDAHLRGRFPALPMVVVQGAVCRPDWLIEVEGVAVTANAAPDLPAF